MSPGATAGAAAGHEPWRTLGGLAAVLAGAAATLAVLDALPGVIAGEVRGVRSAASVEEAERRLRASLLVPAFFPDTIAWPPARIRIALGPQGGAVLSFDGRDGRPRLLWAQAAGPGEVPPRLLPPARALDAAPAPTLGGRATVRRVVGPDGEVWQEVAWRADGRGLVLRTRGGVEEALRMARSARGER
jgi:hypothetical protein